MVLLLEEIDVEESILAQLNKSGSGIDILEPFLLCFWQKHRGGMCDDIY